MNLAVKMQLIAHRLWRLGPVGRAAGKVTYWLARALTLADIDPRAELDATVVIAHGSGVVIGETASVGSGTRIMPGVVIGARDWASDKRHADVGSSVEIGAGAKILGPVKIGDGARIGANAVVLEDVPAGVTVVGVPARPVHPEAGVNSR